MFTNTGNLSFYIGVFFLLLALLGIIFLYKLIKNKTIEDIKIDKLIEIGKWYIVTVAIVISTTIILDGFKERDQDLKESIYYDKYLNYVLNTDSLERKLLLVEYLAEVSPAGELRCSWRSYKKIVEDHYNELKVNKIKIAKLEQKPVKSIVDTTELSTLINRNNSLNTSLISHDVHFKVSDKIDINEAEKWEQIGFDALVSKDVVKAINAFKSSENAYNKYHSVYEIANYLSKNKAELVSTNSAFWKEVYKTILSNSSWYKPAKYITEFNKLSE